jgi:hypothetical protein
MIKNEVEHHWKFYFKNSFKGSLACNPLNFPEPTQRMLEVLQLFLRVKNWN